MLWHFLFEFSNWLTLDSIDILCLVYSILNRNLNKLSIKYQSYHWTSLTDFCPTFAMHWSVSKLVFSHWSVRKLVFLQCLIEERICRMRSAICNTHRHSIPNCTGSDKTCSHRRHSTTYCMEDITVTAACRSLVWSVARDLANSK